MRKPIIAGNWKMNKTVAEAKDLVGQLIVELGEVKGVDVVLCPPFTTLQAVGELIAKTPLDLGAQNMHWEKSGAYTGEVSSGMLRELFCHYVILGHSERRTYFGETDQIVNDKVHAALNSNLHPIVCVGETLEQRESGSTAEVVEDQIRGSLKDVSENAMPNLVIAYEPVWAIGTGLTATPEQAQETHALIRNTISNMSGSSVADSIRIQYGGSMKPSNAAELMSQPDIDGGLIGGAALDARSFADIVRAAK